MKKNGHKTLKTIADLQPDTLNANKGTPRGLQMVEDSLRQYGAGRSILADKQGRIIAGNKTLQSASDIDLPIRVIETNGKELVVVQRTDLDLNDPKARELGIADNRSSQVGLEWDAEILAQLKDEGVELSGMFTEKELAAILPQGESKDAEPQIDKAAELQQKWQVSTGEIIEIGRHRLMCGDSTDKAAVERLCAGNKPLLMVTDPPYGIEHDTTWREDAGISKANRTCYAMEISPEYCAVILERMTTAFPHLEIKREEVAVAA
jgi:hypothetical protein